jgi:hypothetical protein
MPPPIAAADEMMGEIRREILRVPAASTDGQAPAPEPGIPAWQWGNPVHFRKGEPWSRLLISGWSYPEPDFIWSDGPQAIIEIEAPPTRREVLLRFSLVPFCPPGVTEQVIRISDGHRLLGLTSVAEPEEPTFLVPAAAWSGGPLRLCLLFPNAISPFQAGISDDHRKLAIALKALTGYLL